MKNRRRGFVIGLWIVGLSLVGCASQPTRFYSIQPESLLTPDTQLNTGKPLEVLQVSLPAPLDRPQIVVTGDAGQTQVLDSDLWTGSLKQMITQTIAVNLMHVLKLDSVYAASNLNRPEANLRLLVEIHQLTIKSSGGWIEATWQVQDSQNRILAKGTFSQPQAVDSTLTSLADKAHFIVQKAITALSQSIATALLAQQAFWKQN